MNKKIERKILCNLLKEHWQEMLLDFIVFIGSIVTIIGFYIQYTHSKTNNAQPKPDNNFSIWDLLLLIFLLIILAIYIIKTRNRLFKWDTIHLERTLFFDFITERTLTADDTIKNLAGDLSWLDKQFSTYQSLINNKPNIKIQIFFDQHRIASENTKSLITEYEKLGIQMIPYPFDFPSSHLKGLIIDTDENAEFLSFFKKDKNTIFCKKYNKQSSEFSFANTLVETIYNNVKVREKYKKEREELKKELKQKAKILVGISGINNIGKTTLAKNLKLKYEEKVIVIQDSFKGDLKKSNFDVALFCIVNQLLEFQNIYDNAKDETIFIVDRTVIDNFAFLKYYDNIENKNEYQTYISTMQNEMEKHIKSFNLIALLEPEKRKHKFSKTRYLETYTRHKIKDEITKLYGKIALPTFVKYKIQRYNSSSKKQFDDRINEITDDLIIKIDTILNKNSC